MSALWTAAEDGPGTHVLVIGVSAYRNQLEGGAAPKAGSVTAAARSARAIVSWAFEAEAQNQFSPALRCVSAAISEPGTTDVVLSTPDGDRIAPEPTLSNLIPIVDAWIERLDQHPENVGIIYLVGHGFAGQRPFLLTEDYGSRKRDKYHGLIDVTEFYQTLRTCQARTIVMFADCCQEFEPGLFTQLNSIQGEAFGSADYRDLKEPQRVLVSATEPGGKSRGDRAGRTYFCDGLLYALRGAAAKGDASGAWPVTVADLAATLSKSIEAATGTASTAYWNDWSYDDPPPRIVALPKAPDVEMRFQTDPANAMFSCRFDIFHQDGGVPDLPKPSDFTYRATLPAKDGYVASAKFDPTDDYGDGMIGFSAQYFSPKITLKTTQA
ncbi:MAG: hypothetical protein AAFQ58_01275 [Pseudomonadota bacterium]